MNLVLTLQDALALKNRVLQRKKECLEDVMKENSKIEGGIRSVDVDQRFTMMGLLSLLLVKLKSKISEANQPVRDQIEELAECKSQITDLRKIDTTEGTIEPGRSWSDPSISVVRTVVVSSDEIKHSIRSLEQTIDKIQRKLAKHNTFTNIQIEVDENVVCELGIDTSDED